MRMLIMCPLGDSDDRTLFVCAKQLQRLNNFFGIISIRIYHARSYMLQSRHTCFVDIDMGVERWTHIYIMLSVISACKYQQNSWINDELMCGGSDQRSSVAKRLDVMLLHARNRDKSQHNSAFEIAHTVATYSRTCSRSKTAIKV